MPVSAADIDRIIARRVQLALVEQQLEQRSLASWPELRGAVAELDAMIDHPDLRAPEVMIAGPSETGKTTGALWVLDRLMRLYPGAQATICRKLRSTMDASVLRTWARIIAIRGGVRVYGGERPQWYDYNNGSRVWVAGLDDPGKALSSERDYIYVNQAEELEHNDWQTLTTRTTGRGAVAPFTMLFGDCNPGPPTHWILHRRALERLESRHEDNPSLFTADGQLTPQGVRTMATLDALEGVLHDRLRFGRWVAAEGAVYSFDRRLHLISRAQLPAGWQSMRRFRAIDFGYTNPFVCLWAVQDDDGRLYIYRQLYMTERTVDVHARQIQQLEQWYWTRELLDVVHDAQQRRLEFLEGDQLRAQFILDEQTGWIVDARTRKPGASTLREKIQSTVADHDAEDRATLLNHGIVTIPANKAISPGIQAVQKRLRKAGDGLPRLFVVDDSLVERDERLAAAHQPYALEQEFDVYVWPKAADGKPIKETPVKMYDHALDALRYLVMHVERTSRSIIR